MGAIVFFFLFMSLIPVCSLVMELLVRLGVVQNVEDPAEWDFEEEDAEAKNGSAIPVTMTVVGCAEPKKAG